MTTKDLYEYYRSLWGENILPGFEKLDQRSVEIWEKVLVFALCHPDREIAKRNIAVSEAGFGKSVDSFIASHKKIDNLVDPARQKIYKKEIEKEIDKEIYIDKTEDDIYLEKLVRDFGVDIMLKAQKQIKGWGKKTAKDQYEYLREQKENAQAF